jgi:hypothetical protein
MGFDRYICLVGTGINQARRAAVNLVECLLLLGQANGHGLVTKAMPGQTLPELPTEQFYVW